ncbi:DUF5995 family protein [Nocardia sp. NBC_01009]|uniref:DUF5995 family protein n=1 Tax=Nocardia sp. NBC_01009 TaxID=2975996 RepID=UPI00386C9E7B|nr:DUF5995 family protein [Nocardia sp. NBC_01009]
MPLNRMSVLGLVSSAFAAAAIGSAPIALAHPARPVAVKAAACGTALSSAELDTIVRSSDTATLAGDSLQRLENAVWRHREITRILVAHGDRRGVFSLGLDAVEESAVMPLQRDPSAFLDRDYAHAISLELLSRYLDNVHAAFGGGVVEPQWANYFEMAQRCDVSAARLAMAGYNAHLAVDLSYSVAAVCSAPRNARDYFKIVDAIATAGHVIVDRTEQVYHGDLGPLWRFYFVGEGMDLLLGRGVATGPLLRLADLGANVVIFGNGLALRDSALHDPTTTEIHLLTDTAEVAFDVLVQLRGL